MTTIKAGRTMKALRAGQGSSDVLVDLDGTGYTTIGTGVTAEEAGKRVNETKLTFKNVSVATTDNTTNGAQGSLKIYDFPETLLHILGAVTNLTISRVGTQITATAAVVASLGTAAAGAGDATLTGTEADVVPSTAATLVAGAATFASESTAALQKDGSTTAVDLYLNFAIPDVGSGGNDAILVNGTVLMSWVGIGDN
jgi:hypothetical protein